MVHNDNTTNLKFGIQISFERNSKGINGILINYHLTSSMLVLLAAINFLIDQKDISGRASFMVAIFLVLTTIFTSAQVTELILSMSITQKINILFLIFK